jgi:tetratricopeptide (TPR) repeat protein
MKLYILPFLFLSLIHLSLAQKETAAVQLNPIDHHEIDSRITKIESSFTDLSRKVEIIDQTQLNYKIEKDLIRETYSSNYKTINSVISIALGIIAILGFVGIKDISKTKDKYEEELKALSALKLEFEQKTKEVEKESDDLNTAVSELIKGNQEQDRKIKFLELKDRMIALEKEGDNMQSLEFANLALELQPEDELCTNYKSNLLVRLNQLPLATKILREWIKKHPENEGSIVNFVEQLYFAGDFEQADKIINDKPQVFRDKQLNGKLPEFLGLFKLFHNVEIDKLKQVVTSAVSHENMKYRYNDGSWSFKEALHFIHYCPDSEQKRLLQHFLLYLNNQFTGEEMLKKLSLPLPDPAPPHNETEESPTLKLPISEA